jgi:hypothetical protein
MASDGDVLNADTIRLAIATLRAAGAPAFTSDRYLGTIDPWWLETPARRYQLWAMLAQAAALDAADA